MGKYLGGLIIIVIALLALEWFGVIDIPYVDLPDFTGGKQDMMNQTQEAVEGMD